MNKFKKLTIEELMKLLIELTRDNENQIREFNQSISLLSKSGKPLDEIQKSIKRFHGLIQESIGENRMFVDLFKTLVEFNRYFNNHLELKYEDDAKSSDENEVNFIIERGSDVVEKTTNEINPKLESKSLEELRKLLEQYILEERYEECLRIKQLIEKVS